MADQAERVILEAEDTPVLESVGRANTALDSFEKKSESSHGKVIVTFRQGCLLPPGAWFLRER